MTNGTAADERGSREPGRLLIASFHLPPAPAVGGLRWWGLSRHLTRRGWEVQILTAQPGADQEAVGAGMKARVITPEATLHDRYLAWRDQRRESGHGTSSPAPTGPDAPGTAGSGLLRTVRRDLGGVLAFPGPGAGWIRPLARAVRNSLQTWRPDLVVSTGPPHSVHLGALLGLRGRHVHWVADFRDPWSDGARAHLDVSWAGPLFRRLEATVVRGADLALTTTPEFARLLDHRFPGARIQCLHNGVDTEPLPARVAPPRAGFTMVHLGTLYHRRDPVPPVRAFAVFLRRHPDARREASRLRFVGHAPDQYRDRVLEVARELGVANSVEFTGMLPREDALQILAPSHVSLVLAQDQGMAVPAKIYESVAMGIPTLVVTEGGSASATAARRLGQLHHPSEDLDGMAQSMGRAWTGEWTGGVPDGVAVDYADLAAELEALLLGLKQ